MPFVFELQLIIIIIEKWTDAFSIVFGTRKKYIVEWNEEKEEEELEIAEWEQQLAQIRGHSYLLEWNVYICSL